MARYYIAFESMKRFLGLRGNETLGELVKRERERGEYALVPFQVEELSKCKEFQDVRLRMNEKRILNQLNKDKHRLTIRYIISTEESSTSLSLSLSLCYFRFPINGKIKSTDMKVNW